MYYVLLQNGKFVRSKKNHNVDSLLQIMDNCIQITKCPVTKVMQYHFKNNCMLMTVKSSKTVKRIKAIY